MLRTAVRWGKTLVSSRNQLTLALSLWLWWWWLLLLRWHGQVLGLMLVQGHSIRDHTIMLRLLVLLVVVWAAVWLEVLLWWLMYGGVWGLLVMRWCNPMLCLALVSSINTVADLLRDWVTPVPELTARKGHVWWTCRRGLVGAFHTPIQLVLSMTLEVVLWLRLCHPSRRLLLVQSMPCRCAHGWTILRMPSPQVFITPATLLVAAHARVRSCGWEGARHTRSKYSSCAIHINLAVYICYTEKT